MVKDETNLNKRDSKYDTAIHIAIELDRLEIIKYLGEQGTNLHIQDSFRETPLYCAIRNRKIEAVKFLAKKGSDLNKRNDILQYTPLQLATLEGYSEIIEYLFTQQEGETKSDQNTSQIKSTDENIALNKKENNKQYTKSIIAAISLTSAIIITSILCNTIALVVVSLLVITIILLQIQRENKNQHKKKCSNFLSNIECGLIKEEILEFNRE